MVAIPYVFSAGTTAQSAQVNSDMSALAAGIKPTFVFTFAGSIFTYVSPAPAYVVPRAMTIEKAFAYVKTAPTGAAIICDININGTSIWNSNQANRVQVADAANSGTSSIIDTTSLSEGDILTMDVDQVGSTTPGSDLTVELRCG
jgi:hypothetical protein